MEWIRTHPVLATVIAIGLIVGGGALLAWDKIAFSPNTTGGYTWGQLGAGEYRGVLDGRAGRSNGQQLTPDDLYEELVAENQPDISIIPQTDVFARFASSTTSSGEILFSADDIAELIAALGTSAQVVPPQDPFGEEFTLSDVYSFLPGGLISTTSQTERKTLRQRTLFDYGNEVGSYVESFRDFNRNQSNTLRQFLEDTGSETKAEAVRDLGNAFQRLGRDLARMDNVPSDIETEHLTFARGYETLGELLLQVAEARDDEALLSAIQTYNAAADEFAESYLTLITIFSINEVEFNSYDSGRMFTFSSF